jgi:hypothetical protein
MPVLIDITAIFRKEGAKFRRIVTDNVNREYPNNDYLRTMDETPLRQEESIDMLSIFGWAHIENVERGIPPLAGKSLTNRNVKEKLYQWSIRAGITFEKDNQRRSFAWALRRKILYEGTARWRSGQRKEIYTQAQEYMFRNIADKAAKIIINTRIL